MKQELSDKQRERMFKIRDDFLGSIRDFFNVHIITSDLEPIEKLVRVNRRFFDKRVEALKKRAPRIEEPEKRDKYA